MFCYFFLFFITETLELNKESSNVDAYLEAKRNPIVRF